MNRAELVDVAPPARDPENAQTSWSLPPEAIAAIAAREGWPLDLTNDSGPRSRVPEQLEHYVSETLAAHAAVVLAKTQATAARSRSEESNKLLRKLQNDLQAERNGRKQSEEQLDEVRRLVATFEEDRARLVAETETLRSRLSYEHSQRVMLANQLDSAEAERLTLYSNLGWAARRRLQRNRNQ